MVFRNLVGQYRLAQNYTKLFPKYRLFSYSWQLKGTFSAQDTLQTMKPQDDGCKNWYTKLNGIHIRFHARLSLPIWIISLGTIHVPCTSISVSDKIGLYLKFF